MNYRKFYNTVCDREENFKKHQYCAQSTDSTVGNRKKFHYYHPHSSAVYSFLRSQYGEIPGTLAVNKVERIQFFVEFLLERRQKIEI